MSYGDIADYLGAGGPRQVGRVMALWGGGVAWWRVVHADGSLLAGHEREAAARYAGEGTPVRAAAGGRPGRVDMRRARWDGADCRGRVLDVGAIGLDSAGTAPGGSSLPY